MVLNFNVLNTLPLSPALSCLKIIGPLLSKAIKIDKSINKGEKIIKPTIEINKSKNNLLNLELDLLFREYLNENKALVLIEEINTKQAKVYLKTKIQTKEISKNLNINIRNDNLNKIQFYEKIIFEIKKEMTNLIKSQNNKWHFCFSF